MPTPKTGEGETFLKYVQAAVNAMGRRIKVATSGRIWAIRIRPYGLRQRVLSSIRH